MRRDDIRRLTEQRKSVFAAMQKLNEDAEKENRSLSAEENEQFDKMATEFEELKEREERATRLFVQEREVEKTAGTPIETRVGDSSGPASLSEYREQRGGTWQPDEPEVRSAYYRYLIEGDINLDVEEKRALSRATGAAGNFLVPTDMANQIIEARRWLGTFGNLANEIVTDGGETINLPVVSAFGAAAHTAENAATSESDETFGQVALGAHKVTRKTRVSEELVQDNGFPLDQYLGRWLGESIALVEESAYISGSGTGQAQGVLPALPTYTAATGNATSFSYSELVRGMFTLPAQYEAQASWLVSRSSARNLYLMVDGQGRPLWNVNVAASAPDTFLGFPIYTHPDMPAPAASTRSIAFGDWRRAYTIRRVRGFSLQRQGELHSDNGQVGFRGLTRYDGRVTLAEAGVALVHSAT